MFLNSAVGSKSYNPVSKFTVLSYPIPELCKLYKFLDNLNVPCLLPTNV